MGKLLAVLPALLTARSAAAYGRSSECTGSDASPLAATDGQWVVTFFDDFEGNALNSSAWNVSDHDSTISEYDGHDALFVKERVSVANSNLIIETILEPQVYNGVSYNMTSGWVDTKGLVSQYQGRFEASMKMPDAGAQGAWPAWWLLPSEACWPVSGEIDIVEIWMGEGHFQHNRPGNPISMASSYHHGYGCSSDKYNYNIDTQWFPNMSDVSAPVIDFSADYHTFGVEWNDTALRFYVDGNTSFIRTLPTMCVTDPTWRAQGGWGKAPYMPWEPTYGIINVAVSQSTNIKWWQTHNATTYVDWVRWYQWVPSTAHTEVHASGQEEEGQAV